MERLAPPVLEEMLAERIRKDLGLHFPPEKAADLRRGIAAAAKALGRGSPEELAAELAIGPWSPRAREALAASFTVGETYFFRDRGLFELLAERVLPDLLRRAAREGRPLRAWSAGCCTGEEPYSLAMTLADLPGGRDAFLLATDINPAFLARASAAEYGNWSFRDAPPGIRERYFLRLPDGRHALRPELRRRVHFQLLNLATGLYPTPLTHTAGMDLILCRNVLMYFAPETSVAMVRRFAAALAPGGVLVLGPSESHLAQGIGADLSLVIAGNVFLHVKRADAGPPGERDFPALGGHPAPVPGTDPGAVGADGCLPPPTGDAGKAGPIAEGDKPRPGEEARREAAPGDRGGPDLGALLAEVAEGRDGGFAMARLSRAYADLGRLDDALYWGDQASGAEADASLEFLRAAILLEKGEGDQAERLLRRVLHLEPAHVLARVELGNQALRRGEAGTADFHYRAALELLRERPPEDLLPDSGGVAAGTLRDMVEAMLADGKGPDG